MNLLVRRLGGILSLLTVFGAAAFAQRDRITSSIDGRQTTALPARMHRLATAANDRGTVDDSFAVPGITVLFKPTAAQKADMQQLLQQQQDPASPNYHRWLTPEEYADRFGVSAADVAIVSSWLKSQGFAVTGAARGRNWVTFDGDAGQVRKSLGGQIHRYSVNGQAHYGNAGSLQVPAALAGIVAGFRGLDNFHPKPRIKVEVPQMTTGGGTHHMVPDDFATIYNVAPLYQAGVDGTGQKLVVVGQTDIKLSDITSFRSRFNLPPANLQQVKVPGRPDPGTITGDMQEADLDIEWSGAVARNATVIYVYSDDVFQSAMYAIDQNLAPVLTMSYGGCELGDLIDLPSFQTLAQQANSEGITWLAAAGDSGAADCEDQGALIAQNGLAVDSPGSIPEVTSMGGTEFNEQAGQFWSSSNTANQASALSYIPEMAWNDTTSGSGLSSGGGGYSVFFPRPAWQTGPGLPNDGFRHVPDLSLSASANHDGYFVFTGGGTAFFGGTSVAAPAMAGVVTLLNHYLVSTGAVKQAGLANINPQLYRMAQSAPNAFHDVTTGGNMMPCVSGSPDCVNGSVGFSTGVGYDSATGLGSVDAANLIHQWSAQAPVASAVTPSIDQNPVFQSGSQWQFQVTLSEEAGIPTTLTGMTIDGVDFTAQIAKLFGATSLAAGASASATITLTNVAVPKTVSFSFTGVDASGRKWTSGMAIPFTTAQTPLKILGISNAATGVQSYAPGMIMSIYGTNMGVHAQAANNLPLPDFLAGFEALVNGVPAPIYYVSPNQVNVQIPYETRTGRATLQVGNPYANATINFQVTAAAPGIFTFSDGVVNPNRNGAHGQEVLMFITGEGQVTPSLPTGTAPAARTVAQLPKPVQAVTVTVGGVAAITNFVGIPNALVGVTQINFTIPATAPAGVQPVVVTVGGVPSPAASITVTN